MAIGSQQISGGPTGVEGSDGLGHTAWDAKVARAEQVILSELFDAFELTRVFLRLTVADVAQRAHMSRRMLQYHRRRKARLSLRQLIAIAEAHDLQFTIRVRMKRRSAADGQQHVTSSSLIHQPGTTVPLEEPPHVG